MAKVRGENTKKADKQSRWRTVVGTLQLGSSRPDSRRRVVERYRQMEEATVHESWERKLKEEADKDPGS